ncbi:MAG: MATE family efflux transporter [Phycisphaerae bacterium]|nr:MATE family efflux transporter [Phycisphaerae bacterium]
MVSMSPSRGRGVSARLSDVREVWSLAWPTVVTMTSYTMMQFVDSLMVAQVGMVELAAQGNGGVWSWAPTSFLVGLITLVNTFVSQSLGAKRLHDAASYAWSGLWIALISWLVLLLPLALFGLPALFASMGHEPRVQELETQYAGILVGAGIVTLAGKAMSNFFFGIHRPKIVAVAAIVGNVVNVVGNFILIYGERGLPSLGLPGIPGTQAYGVAGAAIATVMGSLVEFLIPFVVFLGPKLHAELGTRSAWRPHWRMVAGLIRTGVPNGVQFSNEMVCWALFMSSLVGRFGTDHLAAGWSVLRFMHLSFMPAVGFSVATASLVGKSIGAGRPDDAVRQTHAAFAVSLVYMTIWGIVMLIWRHDMVAIFADSGDVPDEQVARIVGIGGTLMICAAIFQTFDALGIIFTGALRGAGDTLVPGIATVTLSWGLIVGGGMALVAWFPQWESTGPWIAATAYIVIYGLFMAWRFESGRWRSIRLLGAAPEPAPGLEPGGSGSVGSGS